MTPRERFRATMSFQPVDRVPLWEWGPWASTLRRWKSEGMSGDHVAQFADCDPRLDCGVSFAMIPPFERQELSRDERSVTYLNEKGQVVRELHERETSMPEFVQFPVKDRADWEVIRARFDASSPERYPPDWAERVVKWREQSYPLSLSGDRYLSFFGGVRELMGAEGAMVALHDDPLLVHDIMEYFCEFFIGVMERALREAPIDWIIMWEDMAYHTASLISPAMFREFMLPRYARVAEFARRHGVELIFVDSDGHVGELIPLWLEAGVRGVYPMEVAAGMDVAALRREYGRELLMSGGVDKRVLAADRAAIDAELERIRPAVEAGGYIPTIDHSIPPDVPYDNFAYYWEQKKRLIGVGD